MIRILAAIVMFYSVQGANISPEQIHLSATVVSRGQTTFFRFSLWWRKEKRKIAVWPRETTATGTISGTISHQSAFVQQSN